MIELGLLTPSYITCLNDNLINKNIETPSYVAIVFIMTMMNFNEKKCFLYSLSTDHTKATVYKYITKKSKYVMISKMLSVFMVYM